ncbi:flagellar hook-length control protein FliK [Marinobacter zhanjiangensis]|uniref:flagellar hook-length control protein FliK n=1 Tax=Marinobacter zhanjiangensis TaxID=578215 RepID=UPI0016735A0B|nr:flagellar hook-length control protein FliK [Marinobacter zhanjiangensis]
MKLPDGNAINSQPPARPATGADAGRVDPLRQLQSLQLENRQAVVARVAELLTERGQQQAILEVRGQKLTVNLPADGPELKAGDLLRIMREGQSLTLLDKLPPAAETRLGQALIRHLPWQQNLDTGLSQLMNALSAGFKAPPGPGSQPGSSQPLPTTVREALQSIARLLPQVSGDTGGLILRPVQAPPATGISSSPLAGLAAPARPGLDAEGVRQWLTNSGVLTEARLAKGTLEAAPTDLKLALGRLALTLLQHQNLGADQFTRFTPLPSHELVTAPLQFPSPTTAPLGNADGGREAASPGQMLRLLAGMLNRITVNQLHSQLLTTRSGAEGAPQVNTLITDLPWMAPGGEVKTAQLRIDYDKPEREEKPENRRAGVSEWRLNLAMDLDEAGKVFFDVALRQNALSARVWAERQATARQVNQELGALRSRLTDLGLEVSELECRRGQPPTAATRLEHRLLDTRA